MVRGPFALTRLPFPEARAPARPRRRHSVALLAAASLFLGRHDAQADDEAWLAACSPEARKTARDLGLEPDGGDALLEVELRPGPVQAAVSIAASPRDVEGDLTGEIVAAPDGASIHFTKLRLEDGREFPVCAYASNPTGRLLIHFAR